MYCIALKELHSNTARYNHGMKYKRWIFSLAFAPIPRPLISAFSRQLRQQQPQQQQEQERQHSTIGPTQPATTQGFSHGRRFRLLLLPDRQCCVVVVVVVVVPAAVVWRRRK